MIPKYKRPAPPLATTWPGYQNTGTPKIAQAAYDIGWEDFFTDARLKALITIAIRENRDLRISAANIMQAQGQYDVQHAGLFPTISATGGPIYQAPASASGLSFAPVWNRTKAMMPLAGDGSLNIIKGGSVFPPTRLICSAVSAA